MRRRLRRRDPLIRPPKGVASTWTRVRRFLWWWMPWAALAIYFVVRNDLAWALGLAFWALFCFLASPAETPPHYGLDHEFSVNSDQFLTTITGASGAVFFPGNRLTLLQNGDEFYPAMLDGIKAAERSITIEAYIYWAGEIGLKFAEALAAKAKHGIPVKILLDAVGSSTIGDEILTVLKTGGCHLAWYNRVRWSHLRRMNHRTHRKSLIIDGRLAFTGGAGIADHWTGHAQDAKHWRDTHFRLDGPAVQPLQTGFAHNWVQSTGELISGPEYYPHIQPCGDLSVLTLMSSPEVGASPARIMYYLSIVAARRTIDIANPYFVPDEVAVETLKEAAARGVRIRVIVSGIHNDNYAARLNSVRLFGRLLEAGIDVYEYNKTMLHQKTMVVDGIWSTIGTSNFDSRSFAHNEESNVCVCDKGLAGELTAAFEKDLAASDKVSLEKWKRRPIHHKLAQFLASFLQDQV
jgi:cardiolipin synthase